jgi:predicted DNA-binding transcriptional regulator AlpA
LAHAVHLREKARQLRAERGLTIDELAVRLALSRSTIYYWVRDLPIPGSGSGGEFPESARRKGTGAMQAKYRRLREEAYADGRQRWPASSPRTRCGTGSSTVDQDLEELTRHWGHLVGADPATIRPQRKSNSNQLAGRTWRSQYGVFAVTVHDTLLRCRLQAWMDLFRESWA